jgi:hypothetical protein
LRWFININSDTEFFDKVLYAIMAEPVVCAVVSEIISLPDSLFYTGKNSPGYRSIKSVSHEVTSIISDTSFLFFFPCIFRVDFVEFPALCENISSVG